MDSNPLVSILIPCYNTQKYLARCLDSVINQTYKNLEIVLLNDGSKDGSIDIMNEYAQKDSRIRVIDRENKGVAISRNELIATAKGEYLMFIDSDDTVSEFIVEDMVSAMIETNSDLVMCPLCRVYENTNLEDLTVDRHGGRETFDREKTFYNYVAIEDYYHSPAAKLYSRKSLKDVEFPLNRIYEDTFAENKIYSNIDRCTLLKQPYYYYLIGRENSITTVNYDLTHLVDNFYAVKNRYDIMMENFPNLADVAKIGFIKNLLTLIKRVHTSEDTELLESETFKEAKEIIPELYKTINDYNAVFTLMDKFKLSCLYLLLNGKEEELINMCKFIEDVRIKGIRGAKVE